MSAKCFCGYRYVYLDTMVIVRWFLIVVAMYNVICSSNKSSSKTVLLLVTFFSKLKGKQGEYFFCPVGFKSIKVNFMARQLRTESLWHFSETRKLVLI